MPYIGNTVQNQGFTPAIDYFSGNGVTVAFTLSRPVVGVSQMIVAVDNVIQNPSSAFTVSGSTITFTSAPLSGTNNIWVEYTSLITTYNAISQDPSVIGDLTASGGFLATGDFGNSYIDGTIVDYVTGRARITTGPIDDMTFYHGGSYGRSPMMDLYYAGGAKIYGTTALTIPAGTTGERPGTPVNGMIRFNTTLSQTEVYQNSTWIAFAAPAVSSVNYLIVAGGAGGASAGGGAGGLLSGTTAVAVNTSYTITVGAGGTGGSGGGASPSATNGANSSAFSLTAIGGGYGALIGNHQPGGGGSGGSGGGGGAYSGATTPGGSGTSGQGNAGGSNGSQTANPYPAGGGGGASAAGQNAPGASTGGYGGAGTASSISGTSVTYAGGGGGGVYAGGTGGAAGAGGGGVGMGTAGNGGDGTANTGGGGGGATASYSGGAGGSGVVIVAYSTAYKAATATGTYTQTVSGGNYIFTFTGSGTITF